MKKLILCSLVISSFNALAQQNRLGLEENLQISTSVKFLGLLSQIPNNLARLSPSASVIPGTTYYKSGQISSKGHYNSYTITIIKGCNFIPTKSTVMSYQRVGRWEFYHKNRQPKAIGKFANYDYRSDHINTSKTSLEVGKWTYYYANGQKMAEGKYYSYSERKLFFDKGKPEKTGRWAYYDEKGQKVTSKTRIKAINLLINNIRGEIRTTAKPDLPNTMGYYSTRPLIHQAPSDNRFPLFRRDYANK
ncbi:hypothetical protein BKI52_08255 [marine bacterium AO1-C]|nr:hypothetical protein BKI52_08255 [marine bacterium AO1-C]